MKSVDALVKKALEYKKRGLTEKEIGDELHLSPETVMWLLTRGVRGGEPPKDVKIGWRSVGVYGNRLGMMASIMSDIVVEEVGKGHEEPDAILGVAINGIPFATLVSEELNKELILFRPGSERKSGGSFSSNYASAEGKKVVIIDDVLSTGDTIHGVVAELQAAGGKPVLAVVVVNKTEKDAIDGVPLRALIRARTFA